MITKEYYVYSIIIILISYCLSQIFILFLWRVNF